jgi:hypothetical protein
METIVLNRQSLPDIAIQASGSTEAMFDIAAANDASITDELSGKTITVPGIVDKQVADYFRINGITPATALTDSVFEVGIGFWTIEFDFEVR